MAQPARQDVDTTMAAAAPAKPGQQWKVPTAHEFGLWTGLEGREDLLGKQLLIMLKTMIADVPYQHHLNDAVIKAHLTAIQFAKNENMMEKLVAHDIKTLAPINSRVGVMVAKTGNKELGLVALFERTDCWYQLVEEFKVEPGRRLWKSPFELVLTQSKRINQFDLTEEEIHENWTRPRILGYAETMNLPVRVSHWHERQDGWLSCELI